MSTYTAILVTSQNTFFSKAHATFSKIDHIIGHKTSLNKFKKIEIISSIFSDVKGLETRNQPQGKKPKTLTLMKIEKHAIKQ